MKKRTDKKCKLCNHEIDHIIVYDCSWYICPSCGAVYEIEEYWDK